METGKINYLSVCAASDVGCVRVNNEDMILVDHHFVRDATYATTMNFTDTDRWIIALADGMGGHNGGEVASEMVLKSIETFFYDGPQGMRAEQLTEYFYDWLESINHSINGMGNENPRLRGMGSTLISIMYYNNHFFTAAAGDSRLYHYRGGELRQMSKDHSLDLLTGAPTHSNILINCIGANCVSSYLDFTELSPQDVEPGDQFMLCSDGLTDMLSDDYICESLKENATAQDLIHSADKAGGRDNVSVCLLKIYN